MFLAFIMFKDIVCLRSKYNRKNALNIHAYPCLTPGTYWPISIVRICFSKSYKKEKNYHEISKLLIVFYFDNVCFYKYLNQSKLYSKSYSHCVILMYNITKCIHIYIIFERFLINIMIGHQNRLKCLWNLYVRIARGLL